MIVGVPSETKSDEYRVALLPVGAEELVRDGHRVCVQRGAGLGSGFDDDRYRAAGAEVVSGAEELFAEAELIVKVKEPQPPELALLGPQHTVFGYFHFAGDRALTQASLERGFAALAYETLQAPDGSLPLLAPMSEVAGRLAVQAGAKHLEQPHGGSGVLLGGVPGVARGHVLVVGSGIVGSHAARLAAGLGARVTLMDVDLRVLRQQSDRLPANVTAVFADAHSVDAALREADLVIGAVLIPGRTAPKLVRRAQLAAMRPGSVIVDVCIDQGGCLETSRPTTHRNPTYVEMGVVHYAVANMPGAVSKTSTPALCNATLPYVQQLAKLGRSRFCELSPGHLGALNLLSGRIHHPAVARAFPELPACQGLLAD